MIEAWIGPDEDGNVLEPSHAEFWRASPEGLFFTRRGYSEDDPDRVSIGPPGTTFDITTATWRVGEILLQVFYIASAIGAAEANLLARFRFTGLAGRRLVSATGLVMSGETHTAHQDTYTTERAVNASDLPDNLPEIVFDVLEPLYQLFDFWRLPKRLVENELRKLRGHQHPR